MPTYDYQCPVCGATAEVRHPMAELDAPSAQTILETTCSCTAVLSQGELLAPGTPMVRFLAGAPAFGKIASMSPQQRQQVLKARSRQHFQREGREVQRQKLGDFTRQTDKKLGLA